MSWEQRNADFCKAQTDAQMAYIEAEREVDRLQAENTKLRAEHDHMWALRDTWQENDAKLRALVRDMWQELDALVPYDPYDHDGLDEYRDRMRELGIEVV